MKSISVWFRGLRGRLLFLVVLPVVALLTVSYISSDSLNSSNEALSTAALVRMPIAQYSSDMEVAMNRIMRHANNIYAAREEPEEMRQAVDRLNTELTVFAEARKHYEEMPRSPRAQETYKKVADIWPATEAHIRDAMQQYKAGTEASIAMGWEITRTKVRANMGTIEETMNELSTTRIETTKTETQEALADAARGQNLSKVIAVVSVLVTLVIGLFLASSLAKNLSGIADRISESGIQVSAGSEQLSSAAQQVSSGSQQAAGALEETVSSLEELSSMVKLNAENSKAAAGLAGTSRESAENGEVEIRKLNEAMIDISQSSRKIEEIINVIDDIAFQTNLLALNAAVEAARAGEQGKGFAVVAEAVRALAQRSATAAKEISSLIKESVSKIERGSRISEGGAKLLLDIVGSVKKVAELNTEIASASQEQSNGLSQISAAMNELDQATQRNASSAEETASASEEMSNQAINLQHLVSNLTALIDGVSSDPVATHPAPQPSSRAVPRARFTEPTVRLAKSQPSNVIPMPTDEPAAKIGTAVGF